jgi:starch-binding outer membrane protein, SusD/RagB family
MRNFKYIILLFSLVAVASSCSKDFVDLNNPNQQTTGTYWTTSAEAIAGVNAVYSTLYYDGLYMRIYPWVMDVRADDMYNTSPWWTKELSAYNYTTGDIAVEYPWEYHYIGVYRANQVITYVPKISMDTTLRNRVVGEAKFLRGLFYYQLEIMFKNIPIVTTLPSSSADYFPKQSPDSTVWKQIISDFTDAMNNLPVNDFTGKTNGYSSGDVGRATKGAAAAYLAKSLMFTQQWSKAAPILKQIIDQSIGTYSLVANYRDNFTTVNKDTKASTSNNSESLFEVQFDLDAGGTTLGWVGEPNATWGKTSGKARTYAPLPSFGYGDITPTDWIYEEFLKEKTKDSTNDPRLEASMFFPHPDDSTYTVYGYTWAKANLTQRYGDSITLQKYNIHVRKYLNDETDTNEYTYRSGIHERIMRYADVLLLYAECQNELGNTTDAYTYIQLVRDRANLPDLATKSPGMTQEEMRTQIAHERALEFCFEAQRYIDLLRWGWITDDTKRAVLRAHDPEFRNWTAGREYFPIPTNEINTNKNLVQNSGW